MDLRTWIADEAGGTRHRLQHQVLDLVPAELRHDHPGGGNSINWGLFHISTHVELALSALLGSSPLLAPAPSAWGGLEESEPDWSAELSSREVEEHTVASLDRVALYVAEVPLDRLDDLIDPRSVFTRVGVDLESYAWLARMWDEQRASFLVQWPLIGHVGNHLGELLSVRNRLGLSPF